MKLKRSQLYARIWASPLARAAADLQVSESVLINACRRFDVPTPPRGYWRKLQVGRPAAATALPNPQDDLEFELRSSRPRGTNSFPRTERKPSALSASPSPQAGSSLEPELILGRFTTDRTRQAFLNALEGAAERAPSKVSAVIRGWIASARDHQTMANLVQEIFESCEKVAQGDLQVSWWTQEN